MSFIFLSSILQTDFHVRQINSNLNTDLVIKRKDVIEDEWLKVKLASCEDSTSQYYFNISPSYDNSAIFCFEPTLTKTFILYDTYAKEMHLQINLREMSSNDILDEFKLIYSKGVLYSESNVSSK